MEDSHHGPVALGTNDGAEGLRSRYSRKSLTNERTFSGCSTSSI